jgi:hypothetical protein
MLFMMHKLTKTNFIQSNLILFSLYFQISTSIYNIHLDNSVFLALFAYIKEK